MTMPRWIAALCLLAGGASAAWGWSEPIAVTADSGLNRNSRLVFDQEGNMHFFFAKWYFTQPPVEHYDIYHCKFSRNGIRLTEDIRLDTTGTSSDVRPSPILGVDQKLHIVWADINQFSIQYLNGIYYSRLNTDGSIDRESICVFAGGFPLDVRLFQDSESNLNVVWLNRDSVFFGKFDTTGQVLIPKTLAYSNNPTTPLYNLEACMDDWDRIHCTYRHYYGSWNEFNLGYTSIDNQGEILMEYAPITPESPYSYAGRGDILADPEGYLHLSYLENDSGQNYQYYHKLDQSLNTIYKIRIVEEALSGSQIGSGDAAFDGAGNVVIVFAYNGFGIDLQYKRATYSTQGFEIISPELILQDYGVSWPDLATDLDGMAVFNYTDGIDSLQGTHILYSYNIDHLGIEEQRLGISNSPAQVLAFPNPSNGDIRIMLKNLPGNWLDLRVMDILGRAVSRTERSNLQGNSEFNWIMPISGGRYYLMIETSQGVIVKPIINLK